MAGLNLFRYLFLVGCFVCYCVCEDARSIQLTVDNKPVYRYTAYLDRPAELQCRPPVESNSATYDGFAIYKDDTIVCKAGSPGQYAGQGCSFEKTALPVPVLRMRVDNSGNYSCQYSTKVEPPVTPEKVLIYVSTGQSMIVYEDGQIHRLALLQVDNETNYAFECPGENTPDSKVVWYRQQHQMKFEHNPNYEFNETTRQLIFKNKAAKVTDGSKYGGTYMCERYDKDGKLLNRAHATVKSHAFASATLKSYNKMEGESVTMQCEIEGEPTPKVTWIRKDKPLTDDTKRIKFGPNKHSIPNATMTIDSLVADDYGDYACIAESGASRAEATVLLRVRSKLAALWPFLGIIVEVIILVAVIFIYEKRRAKKEQEETEDTADQKKSLTASNNENKDVRQRKA